MSDITKKNRNPNEECSDKRGHGYLIEMMEGKENLESCQLEEVLCLE